jgi:hypothetical protein
MRHGVHWCKQVTPCLHKIIDGTGYRVLLCLMEENAQSPVLITVKIARDVLHEIKEEALRLGWNAKKSTFVYEVVAEAWRAYKRERGDGPVSPGAGVKSESKYSPDFVITEENAQSFRTLAAILDGKSEIAKVAIKENLKALGVLSEIAAGVWCAEGSIDPVALNYAAIEKAYREMGGPV